MFLFCRAFSDCFKFYLEKRELKGLFSAWVNLLRNELDLWVREKKLERVLAFGVRGNLGQWDFFNNPGYPPVSGEPHHYHPFCSFYCCILFFYWAKWLVAFCLSLQFDFKSCPCSTFVLLGLGENKYQMSTLVNVQLIPASAKILSHSYYYHIRHRAGRIISMPDEMLCQNFETIVTKNHAIGFPSSLPCWHYQLHK